MLDRSVARGKVLILNPDFKLIRPNPRGSSARCKPLRRYLRQNIDCQIERERLRCYLPYSVRGMNPPRYFYFRANAGKSFARIRSYLSSSQTRLSILRHREVQVRYPPSRWLGVIVSKILLEEEEDPRGLRVAFSWKFLPFREELADNYRARGQVHR